MSEQSPPKIVHCPTCGKEVAWSKKSRWRPFCSERCKLIDLGEWIEENVRIPGAPHLDPDEEQNY